VQERDFVMARTKPPSFDFFPDDFIAGTYHLPAEAVGIYVRLLCYQWNNGSIPSDENELARIAGVDADAMRTHMRTVMLKFMQDGCGGLKNARLELEREHKLSVIEKSKAAADSRWAKEKAKKDAELAKKPPCVGNADAHADAMRTHMRTDMPPTSNFLLPTSNSLNTPLPPKGEEDPSKEKPKTRRKPSETTGQFQPPRRFDTPEVRQALADFESMRLRTGKRIKDRGNVCRGWDTRFVDVKHLLACIDVAISNEYQGISPDYVDPSKVLEAKKPSLWETAKKY
jgi:uncharacterized protein YdaU (DUF1376 family)